MKIVVRIFGVIIILVSLLFGSLSIVRAERDKADIRETLPQVEQALQQLKTLKGEVGSMTGATKTELDANIAEAEANLAKIPSESTYTVAQLLFGALMVLTLAFGVFLFKANAKWSTILAAVAFVVFLAVYFVSPDIERGEYSGANSRTLALLSGIPVLVLALFAIFIGRKSPKLGAVIVNG